jgi:hypothetical protein
MIVEYLMNHGFMLFIENNGKLLQWRIYGAAAPPTTEMLRKLYLCSMKIAKKVKIFKNISINTLQLSICVGRYLMHIILWHRS